MLPVSQYEALLAEVRGLRRKAQRVQQLATPLISHCSSTIIQDEHVNYSTAMESSMMNGTNNFEGGSSAEGDTTCSEDEYGVAARSSNHNMSVSSEPYQMDTGNNVNMLYHGTWPVEKNMWNSEPTTTTNQGPILSSSSSSTTNQQQLEVTSVMSFASSAGGVHLDRVLGSPDLSRRSSQQLEAKVDMVYSLLAMLSGQEHADMGETLLALSTNPESCLAMRQSGCIPLLVQMVQSDREADTRLKASQALHNLVHSQPDEKLRKREIRIFRLLEHTRAYTEALRANKVDELEVASSSSSEDEDRHPVQTIAHIMKLSFDELHRQAICQLGGIHTIANLVEAEHVQHGSTIDEQHCILMRRYACMALTNLTFGDSGNKALLCSFREFMRALVIQLQSPSDELRQVTASVLRNLSWRADSSSKEILREVGSVRGLMKSAMLDNKENTLKSILSALWNLSAHCTENKSEICSVDGALGFLVDMLLYKPASKSLAIIENSGGILRNISSQIAVRDDYREILRQHQCLQILLDQLKSPSLTIVSNACGTLWNLSAKCTVDQEALWLMGAPTMLRSLNHSKHKMIAMGSSAALKNLLSARPSQSLPPQMDATALALDLPVLPTLGARKQKALLQDLDQTLSETYENIEKESPGKVDKTVDYESGFNSLTINEPSTSFSSVASTSLPHVEVVKFIKSSTSIPVRSNDLNKRNFVKVIANNVSSYESFNLSLDVTPQPSSAVVSSTSIDNNDGCKRSDLKLKEVSACSDEKDRCSVEDVSEHSSLGMEQQLLQEDSGCNLSAVRRDANYSQISLLPATPDICKIPATTSHLTMFEGSIDDINMEDILISTTPDLAQMDEKQDVEKEKQSMNNIERGDEMKSIKTTPINSGIPLPKSLRLINDDLTITTKSNRSFCGVPRFSLPSSTPVRLKKESCEGGGLSETDKVQNIDGIDGNCALSVKKEAVKDNTETSTELDLSLIGSKSSSSSSRSSGIFFPDKIYNMPLLNLAGMGDKSSKSQSPPSVNFNLADDDRDHLLERSCEDSNPVDNRMLDPDAMIESLDRFTAELVSQASHLQSVTEDKYKDNTWNEDTSPNEVTFPSISGSAPSVITFSDGSPQQLQPQQSYVAAMSGKVEEELPSNDFSSMNTSTMTQSTLIAMEANKMATVFQNEADNMMSLSGVSLELDQVQQPSLVESEIVTSPKLIRRKKSIPVSLLVRRAILSNSLNNASSLESLSNLDQMNPPSAMGDVIMDMEGSTNSVASLPMENVKTDFLINGTVSNKFNNDFTKIFDDVQNLSDVNPPSIFNEITDMCNSLADVPTEAIGTETELFEDCYTHILPTEDDVTEFSDANSVTPIQSDQGSSPEVSPKKSRSLGKSMTSKQRRNLARDRYKTYTVAAEMVMKEEQQSTSDDFKTVECFSEEYKSVLDSSSDATYQSPTYKITPKERRLKDRERFETQVVTEAMTSVLQQPIIESDLQIEDVSSPVTQQSPMRTKLSIRRNFMQKRIENRDRFKTQTLSLSPELSSASPNEADLHFLVEKEANLVLKSLRETKTKPDELLDCETLSLVSNDDDSEHNSGSSINYRTYHKSWGFRKNVPVIEPATNNERLTTEEVEVESKAIVAAKPKIVKPEEVTSVVEDVEEVTKGIRGRRKPLYTKPVITNRLTPKSLKPIKAVTSNLVKNVTSTLKSTKVVAKSPPASRVSSSGYGSRINTPTTTKTSPVNKNVRSIKGNNNLERQGTFTKDDVAVRKSRIPMPGSSKIPTKPIPSKIPAKTNGRVNYGRSTSADSREVVSTTTSRRLQNSASSQSLKSERLQNGTVKRSSVPPAAGSNAIGPTVSNKKQVTSKIASLWKKIEESKNKQPLKKDTRVWIQGQDGGGASPGGLVRSNTFDNKDGGGVVLRNKGDLTDTNGKRISRLGSFIVMDDNNGDELQQQQQIMNVIV